MVALVIMQVHRTRYIVLRNTLLQYVRTSIYIIGRRVLHTYDVHVRTHTHLYVRCTMYIVQGTMYYVPMLVYQAQ